jgi:hypothetical protein
MPRRFLSFVVVAIAVSCIFTVRPLIAGPLTSAEVTKIINRVSVMDPAKGGHPAAIRDVIKDDLGLQTGEKSRSELLFQDNTLTRIGAETFFSFKTGTRDMTLEKGSMLLQVPKGLGGAKIHTAAVTAAITGTTIMIEYVPDSYIKVLVLEGSLRLARNGRFGDSLVLRPGKMVIMRPDAKKIPDPIDVDLEKIVKTSSLVNFPDEKAPLPSMPLIQAAINEQGKQLVKSNLAPTNLVMGHGTKVILASNDQLTKIVGPLGLLGSTLSAPAAGAKSTLSLPLVGNLASTLGTTATATTTTLTNILNSSTGTVASNLLSTTSTAVSSSTQILSLLNNAVQNTAGIVTVAPTAIVGTTVAAVPTSSVTSAVPLSSSTSPTVTSNPVPLATASGVTPVLSTVTSAPTTLLATQTSPPSPLPLGLGH